MRRDRLFWTSRALLVAMCAQRFGGWAYFIPAGLCGALAGVILYRGVWKGDAV